MLNILVLEDDKSRIDWFKQQTIGMLVDFTDKSTGAIKLLQNKKYDYVYLDHDLMESHYADQNVRDDGNTGYAVALFLEQNPEVNAGATFVVHSLNPSGSSRMMEALKHRKAYRIPFHELVSKSRPT